MKIKSTNLITKALFCTAMCFFFCKNGESSDSQEYSIEEYQATLQNLEPQRDALLGVIKRLSPENRGVYSQMYEEIDTEIKQIYEKLQKKGIYGFSPDGIPLNRGGFPSQSFIRPKFRY
jgi:hypothetical protein